MSIITQPIGRQNFELVGDRIAEILALELPEQADMNDEPGINAKVWLERFVPFNNSEYPAVNVRLAQGAFDNMTAVSSDGTNTYQIDVYTGAKSTVTTAADLRAQKLLQRILGVIRAILSDPLYMTLGFERPSVERRWVETIQIAGPANKEDAVSSMWGRLTFMVRIPEGSNLITVPMIADNFTKILLGETDEGYFYKFAE